MSFRRVRAGIVYEFKPVGLDQFDSKTEAIPGQQVRVIKCPGCPPPNSMGHAHIESLTGEFLGLVCCNSLQPLTRH